MKYEVVEKEEQINLTLANARTLPADQLEKVLGDLSLTEDRLRSLLGDLEREHITASVQGENAPGGGDRVKQLEEQAAVVRKLRGKDGKSS